MNTYRIALINTRLNFRKFVIVRSDSAMFAAIEAIDTNSLDGYDTIESIRPVAY